ncbi:C2 domain-containing protein, putative [Eimeria brunetti]|uniref:C2 domain-containing protein, putative n=1 Tax=Eimeria brunetti TaxID=51314 RepID=U6LKF8_9EIME|nr:C2 domain-containing protein, putative [Eimeria brunetti]
MADITSLLLAATLGGGGPRQPSRGLEMPTLFNCGTTEAEPEEKFVNAPPPKQGPLFLRMCVLSGNDLAAGDVTGASDPYVSIRYEGHSFCSPPQMNTLNPVWEYSFETEIKENGTLHISVYDQDMGMQGDFLGSCQLKITRNPTKLKKETIPLVSVPAPLFSKPPNSRITVFYHVVERLEDQPDLVELARRLGDDAAEKQQPQNMTVRCCCLQTEHPSVSEDKMAALRLTIGQQKAISQPGVPDGLRYLYGPPGVGWQTEFRLKDVTLEDLVQLRIDVEWMLRDATADEIEVARKEYLSALATTDQTPSGTPTENAEPAKNGESTNDGTETDDSKGRHCSVRPKVHFDKKTGAPLEGEQKAQDNEATPAPHMNIGRSKKGRRSNRGAPTQKGFRTYASWQLPLDEIREFCSERRLCAWAGRCVLTSKTGVKSGELLMHVDVFADGEKPLRKVNILRFPPPVSVGSAIKATLAPSGDTKKDSQEAGDSAKDDVTLYLHLYADFLPKTDVDYDALPWNDCDPFVVIHSGNVKSQKSSWTTTVQNNRQREVEWECMTVQVCKDRRRRRLTFELFDSDTPFMFGSGILKQHVGMAHMNRIPLNRPTWLHMFGGAINGGREEYNAAMIKGALEPASTYRGSLCVLADTKRTRRRDWPPFPDRSGVCVHIQVTIGRALYLPDTYRSREVSLLIQVPGCVLEISGGGVVPGKGFFSQRRVSKPVPLTSTLSGVRKCREMSEIPPANADILEFPGYVDSKGVLRFYNWTAPRSQMQDDTATALKETNMSNGKRNSHLSSGASEGDPVVWTDFSELPLSLMNAWVFRESEPVFLLPQVQHAYVYLVPVGEEHLPPKIFGRIPLTLTAGTKAALDRHGASGDANEWPPREAFAESKAESDSELEQAIPSKKETEEKGSVHPAVSSCAKMSWEASTLQDNNIDVASDDGVAIEPLKWIQMHWDQSVTPLPECRFPSTFAACLLASARAVLSSAPSSPGYDSTVSGDSQSSIGNLSQEQGADAGDWEENYGILPGEPNLGAKNEIPEPEVISVFCGVDTRERRCGHARSLPAMDSDALVNPWWSVEVEGELIKMVDEQQIDREMSCLKTSLNPAFLQRTIAPVYLYLSPQTNVQSVALADGLPPFNQLLLPPPPVLLRLFDIDIEKGGEVVKEMIALAVEWSPANLDMRYRTALQKLKSEGSGGSRSNGKQQLTEAVTDVNYAHEAIWYALANREQASFTAVEESVATTLEWDAKPRLLAAVGFAMNGASKSTNQRLGTATTAAKQQHRKQTNAEENIQWVVPPVAPWPVLALDNPAYVKASNCPLLKYHFDVDVLGIRCLPNSPAEQGGSELVLQVSAFWQGSAKDLQLALSSSDFPGPNVVARFSETEPDTKRKTFVEVFDAKEEKMSRQVLLPIRRNVESSTAPGQWVGARLSITSFSTPYLPYIQEEISSLPQYIQEKQQNLPANSSEDRDATAGGPAEDSCRKLDSKGVYSSRGSGRMVRNHGIKAILPDICFRLVNRDGAELGTLSLALNSFVKVPQGEHCLKLQLESPLLARLPPPMMDVGMMEQRVVPDLPFVNTTDVDVLIECFSEHTGELIYDSDCRAGRMLTDHDMFFVRDSAGFVHTHVLNADDYFAGYGEKRDIPFVEPIMQADLTDPGPTPAEYAQFFGETRRCNRGDSGTSRLNSKRRSVETSKTFHPEDEEHEHAPKKSDRKAAGNREEDRVRHATRTWLRKRGHGASLDEESSCLLARLMLMRSEYESTESHDPVTAANKYVPRKLLPTFNMVNLYTRKEGKTTVDKQYHRICVPSLDIRYPHENAFYVYDTITQSFVDFHRTCVEQKLKCLKMQLRGREADSLASDWQLRPLGQAEQQELEVEIFELETELARLREAGSGYRREVCDDPKAGFGYALDIQRGELVCRLKKTSTYFDRNQSVLWFDSFSVLPTLNLALPLVYGEDKKKIAVLKGWVRVTDITSVEKNLTIAKERDGAGSITDIATETRIQQVQQTARTKGSSIASSSSGVATTGYPPPAVLIAPPMHRWMEEVVVVHVYVLTARNLQNVDAIGMSDPYLKLQLGQQVVVSDRVFDGTCNPNFYEHFVFRVLIPGPALLKIIVMDKGDMLQSDSPLGIISVDLEERWLALRASRITQYQKMRPVIGPGKKPYVPPLHYFPIEFQSLQTGESEGELGLSQGTLRYFIDLHGETDPYEELSIAHLGIEEEFELRFIVWNVENINVFKGSSGERNDLKVRVEIFMTDFELVDMYESFDTDVHFFSKRTATFNWRFLKRVKLPLAALSVKLTLIDINAPAADNALYNPETLSLDAMALTAITRYRQDQKPMGPVDFDVIFSDPLGAGMVEHWCQAFWCAPYEAMGCPPAVTGCCNRREVRGNFLEGDEENVALCCCLGYCCCGRQAKRRRLGNLLSGATTLHCTVSLLPKQEADAQPVGAGRAAPEPLAEPTDRPSPNMILTDPVGYLTLVVGKQTCALIQATSMGCCLLTVILLVVLIAAIIIIAVRI